jgi:ribosomal protein S18 acetylase RimI-like enzyme
MQIRPVQTSDYFTIVTLLHRGLSPYQPDTAQMPTLWREFFGQSGLHARVAVVAGDVVGFGALLVEVKIRGGRLGHIEDIVVAAEARKAGIGRAIIEELCTIAVAEGCYKISLACAERNIDFYRGCGFSVDGVSMSWRPMGDRS